MDGTPPSQPLPHSRKNPFMAAVTVNRRLSGEGSEKETRHYEVSIAGSGMAYECGDSLAVIPSNSPALVEEIVRELRATGDEEVPGADGRPKRLADALIEDYTITRPSPQFLAAVADRAGESAPLLRELLDPLRKQQLEQYLFGLECIDFLHEHPTVRFTPAEFVGLLRKMQPRLYSIASSPKVHPESVHLTVATIRYQSHGRQRMGVASTCLADRCGGSRRLPVFVHTNKAFRLPDDDSLPIIMIGPGTGVAPFRGFLQDRAASGATGRAWLFFGEQRERWDFHYREEFEALVERGVLTRLDTAFSRDQERKIYVQHRMEENAAEFWRWLEEGAHVYVCGDAARMAKDVDAALHRVIREQGALGDDGAVEYVQALKVAKRYHRDVY